MRDLNYYVIRYCALSFEMGKAAMIESQSET